MSQVAWIVIVLIVLVGGYMVLQNNTYPSTGNLSYQTNNANQDGELVDQDDTVTAYMTLGDVMPANKLIVAKVRLEQPGFLAVYADSNHMSGAVLGSSTYLKAGDYSNVVVNLSRSTNSGEMVHITLRVDDGDSKFDNSKDPSAMDQNQHMVTSTVMVK